MKKLIKLKDLTPEQWDNYINKCKMTCDKCAFENACCRHYEYEGSWFNNKDLYSDKFLDQEVEIEMPDILNEQEKEYLSNVIKPFKDKVAFIQKLTGFSPSHQTTYCIFITINSRLGMFGVEDIKLPYFQDEMYEGMEIDKKYTLEDLGL